MRIIVGVTGATGVEGCKIHLVLSSGAKATWELESEIRMEKLLALADVVHDERNMAASISSGSFVTEGMIVMPCSMKTLAGIAAGCSRCLLERGAQSYIGSEGNAAEPHSAKEYERSGGCRMHNCSPGADFL